MFYDWQMKNFLVTLRCGITLDFDFGKKIVPDISLKLLTGYTKEGRSYSWNMDLIGLNRCLQDIGFDVDKPL